MIQEPNQNVDMSSPDKPKSKPKKVGGPNVIGNATDQLDEMCISTIQNKPHRNRTKPPAKFDI